MEKLKLYLCYSAGLLCTFMIGVAIYSAFFDIGNTAQPVSAQPQKTIVIDAGHGGEDGGATANGVSEKDVNLDIALKLRDLLTLSGYNVVMIRETDTSIYDASAQTISEKKVSDLHNRLSIINSSEDNILISIHQNKFEQSQYSGAQIFYSDNNTQSSVLAESIRKSITGFLQPDNKRELKVGGSNIYILDKATVPAVIVECGFISNPDEAEKLSDNRYRTQMAFAIYCGFLEYAKNNI
ncbi:MAG: N-acetylmuramoyl-L-alanine amidase [Acutalibacteraceae bacterium]